MMDGVEFIVMEPRYVKVMDGVEFIVMEPRYVK